MESFSVFVESACFVLVGLYGLTVGLFEFLFLSIYSFLVSLAISEVECELLVLLGCGGLAEFVLEELVELFLCE